MNVRDVWNCGVDDEKIAVLDFSPVKSIGGTRAEGTSHTFLNFFWKKGKRSQIQDGTDCWMAPAG